jgi:adenylate cyclase
MLYNIACALIELDEGEAAIDLLEPIVGKVSASWVKWMETDNDMDPLRGNPRFQAMLQRASALNRG